MVSKVAVIRTTPQTVLDLERIALRSPLAFWAPIAWNLHHEGFWYPMIGSRKIAEFDRPEWGKLWRESRGCS